MCVTVPGQVIQLKGAMAEVRQGDSSAWFNALMVPDLMVGAWVFTLADLVMTEVSPEEARDAMEGIAELQRSIAADDIRRTATSLPA